MKTNTVYCLNLWLTTNKDECFDSLIQQYFNNLKINHNN